MAGTISTSAELLYRFHACEMQVKQGKIASGLIAFRAVIDGFNKVSLTSKEKKEFNESLEGFLRKLSEHKQFKELFGEVSFGDTDLKTNLEFVRSMIDAQEQEIVQKVRKDEEAAEAERIKMEEMEQKKKEDLRRKIEEAINLMREDKLTEALKIIGEDDEIKEAVVFYFNNEGIEQRKSKNLELAANLYSKALSLSPQDENIYYNMGRVYYEQNQLGKAEYHLDRALKINPDFAEGTLFYEHLLQLKNRKSKAAGTLTGGRFSRFLRNIFAANK